MSEEVRKIIKMVQEGRITEEEAVRLIEAATSTARPEAEDDFPPEETPVRDRAEEAVKWVKENLVSPDFIFFALALLIGALLLAVLGGRAGLILLLIFLLGAVIKLWRSSSPDMQFGPTPETVKWLQDNLMSSGFMVFLIWVAIGSVLLMLLRGPIGSIIFLAILTGAFVRLWRAESPVQQTGTAQPTRHSVSVPGIMWKIILCALLILLVLLVCSQFVGRGSQLFGMRSQFIHGVEFAPVAGLAGLVVGLMILLLVLGALVWLVRGMTVTAPPLSWPGLIWRLALLTVLILGLLGFFLMWGSSTQVYTLF